MSPLEEKIDKLIESQSEIKTDIAVIKTKLTGMLEDFTDVKKSHYKLRDSVSSIKGKVVLIAAIFGAAFTFVSNWIYKHVIN